ncbi:MAG: trypsin-like peptidase domain-containing protein [Caldilineaceae bacterium]
MRRILISLGIGALLFNPTGLHAAPEAKAEKATTSNAVHSYTDVKKAVVRVEVEASFLDLDNMTESNTYVGSAFLINRSGLAVTDNHVTAGAAALKVYVDGESKPRNAKVLGVSECSDLAVIDIQGNDDFPYLEWYDGDIEPGLKVFAAGFPLGDPEYTLTANVVNKAKANGQTSWASLDYTVQHGAQIMGGNSGGPLVTEEGKVVGVNFAGNALGQNFAIPSAIAQPIVEELSTGRDRDTIGIFGQAFTINEQGKQISGIIVQALASGSPAGKAGIKRGDILLSLEGQKLGEDGTMSMYCDILRSHQPDDVLNVQLARITGEGEVQACEGELNGVPLTCNKVPPPLQPIDPTTFRTWTDRNEIVSVSVPAEWNDTNTFDWVYKDETIGVVLLASTDLSGFDGGWSAPGMWVMASDKLGSWSHEEVLNTFADQGSACKQNGPYDFENSKYSGIMYVWEPCNGDPNVSNLMFSLTPKQAHDIKVVVGIQMVNGKNPDLVSAVMDGIKLLKRTSPELAVAESVVRGLNLRAGPGTSYKIIGNLVQGERVLVVAQVNNCQWLHVVTANRQEGYVSGAAQFVALSTSCAKIPSE